jgi:hypothetical protein
MKKLIKLFATVILLTVLVSCDDDHDLINVDSIPPAAPTGVFAINGDNRVDISWNENRERDLAGYNVYFSYDDFEFELIDYTNENYFIDYEARNGEVYYYAVTAYDFDGNESELSAKTIVGIARPEGFNQAVFDYLKFPQNSGYSFSEFSVVEYNSDYSDFFFENYEGTYYINVWDDTDIQDMGSTNNIYEISEAPIGGWIELLPGDNVKYIEVMLGNTYVIRTWNNHYAKIRIKEITPERMSFDWAYQLLEGERLLKPESIDSRGFNKTPVKLASR